MCLASRGIVTRLTVSGEAFYGWRALSPAQRTCICWNRTSVFVTFIVFHTKQQGFRLGFALKALYDDCMLAFLDAVLKMKGDRH